MLINIWAHHLESTRADHAPEMIFAGIGKPTYPLNQDLAQAAVTYWTKLLQKSSEVQRCLQDNTACADDVILKNPSAIDYGLSEGNLKARQIMAQALSNWYEIHIRASDVFFTVGGISALQMIFQLVAKNPEGVIVTPSPHYPYYANSSHHHQLHFIDVMQQKGYRLTKNALLKALSENKRPVNAFLFCDPNNPMGTLIDNEWEAIAEVLRTTPPDVPIILDEAYAELVFDHKYHRSLLQIAPDLKQRIIVIRSGTKGFSASGERLCVVTCFNAKWREELIEAISLNYLHAPISLQFAYAEAMHAFTRKKSEELSAYYQNKVRFVEEKLKEMGISLPDAAYRVEGTFYVLADLSCLLGMPIPSSAEKALGKKGIAVTDSDICYSLLFEDRLMLAPFSAFGADPHLGYLRITCSSSKAVLIDMLARLKRRIMRIKAG